MKIVAATSVCIFSLFSVFAGTTAWFLSSQNSNHTANEMQITEGIRQFKKIELHRFVRSGTESETPVYYFDQTVASSATVEQIQAGTASLEFVMDKYTLLRHTNPTLALIELGDTYEASVNERVGVSLSTQTNKFLTEYEAAVVAGMTTRPLSNIIKASAGYLTATVGGDATTTLESISKTGSMTYAIDGETTSSAQYFFNVPSSYSQFVTFSDATTASCATDLSLFSASSGQKVKYLYIIFDYNVTALESIYNHFLGQPFLEEDLHFQCDWTVTV